VSRKAVITGLGVRAPGGVGTKAFWELISAGRTATRTISHFDATPFRSRIAAEVDFDPVVEGFTQEQIDRHDRVVLLALACARDALADSGLTVADLVPERTAVSIGSAVGCTIGLDTQYAKVSEGGQHWLVKHELAAQHLFDYLVPTPLAAEVARSVGAEGHAAVISTGCTSGLDAVGYATDLVREGSADVMLAGASDAPISPITVACFDAIKATSPRNDEPETASRPFDRTRNGFVLGEGAAVFVVEELEHARSRGARIYAEVAGFAARSNAYHMTGLRPDGREMAEAITSAMDQARVCREDIDYINAHGSGTKQNDLHETTAFKRSLGDRAYEIPVSSLKSMIGHSLGAIGSIELAGCVLAMENGVVPPTANLHEADPACDLDYVPLVARERQTDTVLSVGSGFGGFQSAVVLARPAENER
jgi:minimal PKS ketosynthase (KS/KS alpha)